MFPPATPNDHVIFGVNSVRPLDEVQDVVYLPASESASETTVQVSFLSFVQHGECLLTCTNSVH